jgi:NADH-quinone oxidoreductase subunit G
LYLAAQLTRALGSPHVDHRLRQGDFRLDAGEQGAPWLGVTLDGLAQADFVLLIGANPRKEQPLLAHRIRQAALRGAQVVAVNAHALDWNFPQGQSIVLHPAQWVGACALLVKALARLNHHKLPEACRALATPPPEVIESLAQPIKAAKRGVILLGAMAQAHPDYALLRAWSAYLAREGGLSLGLVPEANGVGAYQVGAVPQVAAGGLAAQAQWDAKLKSYLLLGFEPEHDTWNPAAAQAALAQAQCVVGLSAYQGGCLAQYAQVLLPIAEMGEYAGSRVNGAGAWQDFQAAVNPPGEARPAWKVLRVLANQMGLPGFTYNDLAEVQAEAKQVARAVPLANVPTGGCELPVSIATGGLLRFGATPLYASDPLVRRAAALQATADARRQTLVRLHPDTAARLGLAQARQVWVTQGELRQWFGLCLDTDVAPEVVWLPVGASALGAACGNVELEEARG